MQLPQIRINSQMAQIRIQQSPGKQEIQQPQAEVSIQQPDADLSITTTPSKLRIDQTQAWEDMNLMHISKRIEAFANEGHQAWLEGMGRRAAQGSELMKIENDGNPIVRQAEENAYKGMKSLGIEFIPSGFAVKTSYQPSEVNVNITPNPPIIDAQARTPIHDYEQGSVDIGMKQYQDLNIYFVNLFT